MTLAVGDHLRIQRDGVLVSLRMRHITNTLSWDLWRAQRATLELHDRVVEEAQRRELLRVAYNLGGF